MKVCFSFFFSFHTKYELKISKYFKYIFILLNLIELVYNSISSEIKVISLPYLRSNSNLNSRLGKIRYLSDQNIYGSTFGINYYYTNIYLGENMQKQGLILDTGSSITTSTCSPLCEKCGKHLYPPYEIKSQKSIISCSDEKCKMVLSKCSNNLKSNCNFAISYMEGSSLKGLFINELIRFGKNYTQQKGTYIPMGCTTSETHLFFDQEVNGIMGLTNNKYNFVEILYKSGAINRNIFSLCYAQLGGVFTMGEINDKIHTENVTFLPMITDRDKYYGLNISSIYVNDKKVENFVPGKYNIFIDSGTTISYINDKISSEMLFIMNEECKKFNKSEACGKYEYKMDYGHCFLFNNTNDLNYAVNHYWPIMHFNLDGYDYKWTPQRYVFNITTHNETGACLGFAKSHGNKINLGASWIIGHDIIFDIENKLIGFAEADCYQNKNINVTNGLELNNEDNYIFKKMKFKNNITYVVIIFAGVLLSLLIIFIIIIIFRPNKQPNLIKEIKLRIKERRSKINKNDKKKDKDTSYIKVLDESGSSSNNRTKISLN